MRATGYLITRLHVTIADMAYLNGEPVSPDALQALALVPYGHFTSMRVDDHQIKGYTEHMDRLSRDCRSLFDTDLDINQVRSFVKQAVAARSGSFVVRVTIFDPDIELGHPGSSLKPGVLVTARPASALPPSSIRVQTAIYNREFPAIKHAGLLGSIWFRRQAQLAGYDDSLFIDNEGYISEGATWNVGFFNGTDILWPSGNVLTGVTMTLLNRAYQNNAYTPIRITDLSGMQAAFATNTTIGVRAISAIDNREFSADHPIFPVLRKAYDQVPPERI